MAAISLTRRQCGFFLLGALLVVSVCDAVQAEAQATVKKADPRNNGPAVVTTTGKPGGEHASKLDNVTVANKTESASNVTVALNSTHLNGTEGGANATVHNGLDEATTEAGGKASEAPSYYFTSWITWKEDNYLMSIMIPVACGVGAAVLILCSLACIGCCRRRCRSRRGRRNLPKKIDPKTFRKMKAADRIKLLAASSDEEF